MTGPPAPGEAPGPGEGGLRRRVGVVPTAGRVLAFVAASLVYDQILRADAARSDPGEGGNIGAGLLAFALTAVAAGVWAVFDRVRGLPLPALLVRWGIVAAVIGLWQPLHIQLGEGFFDWRVLAADLVGLGPFSAGLVFVPAALGGLLGRERAGRSRSTA